MNKNENEAIDFEIGKLVAMKIAKDFNYSIDHKIETGMIDLQGIALPFLNAKDASYTTKLKVLEEALETADKMLGHVNCIQNCQDGGVPSPNGEDDVDWVECQWCAERKHITQALARVRKDEI